MNNSFFLLVLILTMLLIQLTTMKSKNRQFKKVFRIIKEISIFIMFVLFDFLGYQIAYLSLVYENNYFKFLVFQQSIYMLVLICMFYYYYYKYPKVWDKLFKKIETWYNETKKGLY